MYTKSPRVATTLDYHWQPGGCRRWPCVRVCSRKKLSAIVYTRATLRDRRCSLIKKVVSGYLWYNIARRCVPGVLRLYSLRGHPAIKPLVPPRGGRRLYPLRLVPPHVPPQSYRYRARHSTQRSTEKGTPQEPGNTTLLVHGVIHCLSATGGPPQQLDS